MVMARGKVSEMCVGRLVRVPKIEPSFCVCAHHKTHTRASPYPDRKLWNRTPLKHYVVELIQDSLALKPRLSLIN